MKTLTKSVNTQRITPSVVISFVVALALTLLGIGTLLLQKQLRQTINDRSQAATSSGVVELKQANATLDFQSESTANLTINTNSAQISALQVLFRVEVLQPATGSTAFGSEPTAQITNPDLHLAVAGQFAAIVNGDNVTTGYIYTGLIIPAPGQPFATTTDEPLLSITFAPASVGTYVVSFDSAQSIATLYGETQDVLKTVVPMNFAVDASACQYTYGEWSACQNGQQIRNFTAAPPTCPNPNQTELERSCNPQCVYQYSDWSACAGGWQTRTQTTNPANCTWYTQEPLAELSRVCGGTNPNSSIYPYTYEACWDTRSEGGSSYVVWNKTSTPNVTAIDVSVYSDFREFAHKDVTGATSPLAPDHLVTDMTNFRTVSDGKNTLFSFYPDTAYYFRLYNGQHSNSIRYFVPKCAGVGGVDYKQCNETCQSNAECATNLTCSNGQCRRAGNTGSTACVVPPDNGLNRSCNDYCADNRECGSGLTCFWNRCRNPKNANDTSCRTPSKTSYVYNTTTTTDDSGKGGTGDQESTEVQCNEVCASNRDCAIGLRCYENRCRLPANLASVICSATELGTEPTPYVSPIASVSADLTSTAAATTTVEETKVGWITKLVAKLPYILIGIVLLIVLMLILPFLFRHGSESARTVSTEPEPFGHQPANVGTNVNSLNQPTSVTQNNSMMERLKQRGVQPPRI